MPLIQFQFRRGTAAEWTAANPTLAEGEIAIETDTNQIKIGTGVTPWVSLGYGGIQGPQGPTGGASGPQGPAGASGVNGASGSAGATGIAGITGSTGPQGPTGGASGPQGSTGLQGIQGASGATGTAGINGATGVFGASGTRGATGSTGPQGLQGASGATGFQGASGSTGLTGATGIQGDTGGASGPQGLTGATGPGTIFYAATGGNVPNAQTDIAGLIAPLTAGTWAFQATINGISSSSIGASFSVSYSGTLATTVEYSQFATLSASGIRTDRITAENTTGGTAVWTSTGAEHTCILTGYITVTESGNFSIRGGSRYSVGSLTIRPSSLLNIYKVS